MTENKIPVLAVRQPFAGLIAADLKGYEVRRYPYPQGFEGQKIAIYASLTKPDRMHLRHVKTVLKSQNISLPDSCFVHGAIIAFAELSGCDKIAFPSEFNRLAGSHYAPSSYWVDGKTYFWNLENVQLIKPVTFKFPRGAVVWAYVASDFLGVA